ncbi:NADPH-dependent FMN reductase [Arenibacter sp. M-2]|uniref:NADPH-dependent FMN reductase n=1 Tax=Arenibacter sp. M-2 TaxID=3053612 RepID=UPI0025707018|nr:NADPH-dependent FMN reductase [Arenibacter sp. M-2]MDL5514249.1 NADPH-dependent FMN reductase [Arenibacter sp. M-2]
MSINKKKILAISGSTRKNATNHKILEFIAKKFSDILDIEIYDGVDKLPHFNTELDDDHLPKEVFQFREKIEKSDGILFCTPEYIFSLPGSLKNAIEWNVSTRLFANKPVAIIVASASGEKAFESLGLILETIEAKIPLESRLLIQGAKGKVNLDGSITDKNMLQEIDHLLSSFLKSMI